MTEVEKRLKRIQRLRKEYGFPPPTKPKKAKPTPTTPKRKKRRVTLPSGVRTKKQIKEFKEIMGWK